MPVVVEADPNQAHGHIDDYADPLSEFNVAHLMTAYGEGPDR